MGILGCFWVGAMKWRWSFTSVILALLSKRTSRAQSVWTSRSFGDNVSSHCSWRWWKNTEEAALGSLFTSTCSWIEYCGLHEVHGMLLWHLGHVWWDWFRGSRITMPKQQAFHIPDAFPAFCVPIESLQPVWQSPNRFSHRDFGWFGSMLPRRDCGKVWQNISPGLHWVQIGHGMDVEGWNFNTFIPERWIRSWNTLLSRVWCWFTWCAVWGYQWWCALDCDQVQYSTVAAGAPLEEHPVWWWQTCQVSETWCISYFPNGDWKKLLGQLRFPSDLHGMFLGKEFEPFIDLVLLFIWAWLFCCLLPACCCLCHLRFPHWGWE